MAGKQKNKNKNKKRYVVPENCAFCKADIEPDYKNYKKLKENTTVRGAIIPKKYSGICSKHQRLLGREVKRARNLGLLPFVPAS